MVNNLRNRSRVGGSIRQPEAQASASHQRSTKLGQPVPRARSRNHPIHHHARRRTHEQSGRTRDLVRCYRSQSDARHAKRRWPTLVRADLDGDRHLCPARCERLLISEPIDPGTLRRTPRAVTLTGPFLKHVQAPVAAQELSTRSYLVFTAPPLTTRELRSCPAVNGYVKSFSPLNMAFGQTIHYGPNSWGDAPGYHDYGLRPKEHCGNVQLQNVR